MSWPWLLLCHVALLLGAQALGVSSPHRPAAYRTESESEHVRHQKRREPIAGDEFDSRDVRHDDEDEHDGENDSSHSRNKREAVADNEASPTDAGGSLAHSRRHSAPGKRSSQTQDQDQDQDQNQDQDQDQEDLHSHNSRNIDPRPSFGKRTGQAQAHRLGKKTGQDKRQSPGPRAGKGLTHSQDSSRKVGRTSKRALSAPGKVAGKAAGSKEERQQAHRRALARAEKVEQERAKEKKDEEEQQEEKEEELEEGLLEEKSAPSSPEPRNDDHHDDVPRATLDDRFETATVLDSNLEQTSPSTNDAFFLQSDSWPPPLGEADGGLRPEISQAEARSGALTDEARARATTALLLQRQQRRGRTQEDSIQQLRAWADENRHGQSNPGNTKPTFEALTQMQRWSVEASALERSADFSALELSRTSTDRVGAWLAERTASLPHFFGSFGSTVFVLLAIVWIYFQFFASEDKPAEQPAEKGKGKGKGKGAGGPSTKGAGKSGASGVATAAPKKAPPPKAKMPPSAPAKGGGKAKAAPPAAPAAAASAKSAPKAPPPPAAGAAGAAAVKAPPPPPPPPAAAAAAAAAAAPAAKAPPPASSSSAAAAAAAAAAGASGASAQAAGPSAPGVKPDPVALWNEFDADGSGHMQPRELEALLKKMVTNAKPGALVTPKLFSKAISLIDSDKDGKVEKDEFMALFDDFYEMLMTDRPQPMPPTTLKPNQKIMVTVDEITGAGMPCVNAFGGCEPILEMRVVKGDPLQMEEGGIEEPCNTGIAVQTEVWNEQSDPKWKDTLQLKEAIFSPDMYLQAILWDWNQNSNTGLADKSLTLQQALDGIVYAPQAKAKKNSFLWTLRNLFDQEATTSSTIECSVTWVPMFKYTIEITRAQRLPKLPSLGQPDGSVEVRLRFGEPKKDGGYKADLGKACLWSAKTRTINNSTHPEWNQKFEVVAPGEIDLFLELLLWVQDLPEPIGHSVLDMDDINELPPGLDPMPQLVKFTTIPGTKEITGIGKAQVRFSVKHELVFA